MEELNVIIAKSDILAIRTRIEISLEEIQEKHPERIEYINPMIESINQLNFIYNCLDSLSNQFIISRQRNADLELINLKLIRELENLKQSNKIEKLIEKSNL